MAEPKIHYAWRGSWANDQIIHYHVGDVIEHEAIAYECILDHFSGIYHEPVHGPGWAFAWKELITHDEVEPERRERMRYINDYDVIVDLKDIRAVKKTHRKASSWKSEWDGKEYTTSEAWLIGIEYADGNTITHSYPTHESALEMYSAIVKTLDSKHVMFVNEDDDAD